MTLSTLPLVRRLLLSALLFMTAGLRPVPGFASGASHQPGDLAQAGALSPRYLIEEWKETMHDDGIGGNGLQVLDLDGDGSQEILAGSLSGNAWYIYSYSAGEQTYRQEWASTLDFTKNYRDVLAVDRPGPAGYAVYLVDMVDGIEVYDGASRQLIESFTVPLESVYDAAIADADGDGALELVLVSEFSGLVMIDLSSHAVEWQSADFKSRLVEVGQVDDDPAPEIVGDRWVLDGVLRSVEWDFSAVFGTDIYLADTDADGRAEIISGSGSLIRAFAAETHTLQWGYDTGVWYIYHLMVTDFDADGVQELVYSNYKGIHVLDSRTRQLEWTLVDGRDGGRIAFGDTDGDGVVELVWGASGINAYVDALFIASARTRLIEWQSKNLGVGLTSVEAGDLDGDGLGEIVIVSDIDGGSAVISVYDSLTFALEWRSSSSDSWNDWHDAYTLRLANVDGDSALEILIGAASGGGKLVVYDGVTHAMQWITPRYVYQEAFTALAAGDTDLDGQVEVVGGTYLRDPLSGDYYPLVVVFDGGTGVEEWRTELIPSYRGVYDIEVGDFDADGSPEILFSIEDGSAYLYNAVTRTREWVSPFGGARAVSAVDLGVDGRTELLIGTNTGQLIILDAGTHAEKERQPLLVEPINSLHLFDIDKDGLGELLLTGDNHLYVFAAAGWDLVWGSLLLGPHPGYKNHISAADLNADGRVEVVLGDSYTLRVFAHHPFLGSWSPVPFVRPAGRLEYRLELLNQNAFPITLSMTDVLPDRVQYLDASLSVSAGVGSLQDRQVRWDLEVAGWERASLSFSVILDSSLPEGAQIRNAASVSGVGTQVSIPITTVVDATPPQVKILAPARSLPVTEETVIISGEASDAISGVQRVEVRMNGGEWQPAAGKEFWSIPLKIPADQGELLVEARALDMAGWYTQLPAGLRLIFDRLAPHLVGVSPAAAQSGISTSMPLQLTFSEPVQPASLQIACRPALVDMRVEFSPDGKTAWIHHAPFEIDRAYRCEVSAVRDAAGNLLDSSKSPAAWEFHTGWNWWLYLPLVKTP